METDELGEGRGEFGEICDGIATLLSAGSLQNGKIFGNKNIASSQTRIFSGVPTMR